MNLENKRTTEDASKGLLNLKFSKRDFESDFPVMKTSITTTEKFGKLISSVLKTIFNDYSGCFITPGRGGEISFSIYFVKSENSDPNKVNGIKFISDPRDYSSIFTAYAASFSKKTYELTDECKRALEQFVSENNKVRAVRKNEKGINEEVRVPDWNRITSEVSDNNRFRQDVLYGDTDVTNVKVSGLDIYKFLRYVYGDKDGEDYIEYRARFEAPLSPTYNGSPNRVFVIDRIKKSDIGKILNYNGRPMRSVGGINKY